MLTEHVPDADPGAPTPQTEVRRERAAHRTDAALEAAARGWHVFPVVPGGKAPAWKAWAKHATTDLDAIRGYPGWRGGRRPDPHPPRGGDVGGARGAPAPGG